VIISPAQRLPSLGEQHGEDDPSEPGHGSQDHHVALVASLPRLVLLGWDELSAEGSGANDAVPWARLAC